MMVIQGPETGMKLVEVKLGHSGNSPENISYSGPKEEKEKDQKI